MLDELAAHATVGLESDPMYLATLARYARATGARSTCEGFVQLTYAFTTRGAPARASAQAYAGPLLQLYGASEVGVLFMEGEDGRLHHARSRRTSSSSRARCRRPGRRTWRSSS